MKVALLTVFMMGVSVVMVSPVRAQEQTTQEAHTAQQIKRAFEAGNARALLDAAVDRLEISLFGANTSYSRGQALYVLEDFFRNYPPHRFMLQDHQETDGHRFAMGRYWYEGSDRPLQVYLRLRAEGGGWVLQEIRIGES